MKLNEMDIIEDANDVEFENQMENINQISNWFTFILLLMMIPEFCYTLSRAATLRNENVRVRCFIPALEGRHFTFDQIQKLSQPMNQYNTNCSYYNYDYSKLVNANYYQALEYVNQRPTQQLTICYKYVYDIQSKYSSIYKDFSLFCDQALLRALLISQDYGNLAGNILVAPFGDLLGRKRVFNWGINLLMASGIIMNLALSAEMFVFAKFISGVANACLQRTLEALDVELSNANNRSFRYLIRAALGSGYAYLLLPILSESFENWRFFQWATSISLLFLPLSAWYIPESPRWFNSKQQKDKALLLLKTIKNAEVHNETLLIFRKDNNLYKNLLWHCKHFESLYNPRFWMTLLISATTAGIYCKHFTELFEMKFKLNETILYEYLGGISEFISLLVSLPLAYCMGRRYPIMILTLATATLFITLTRTNAGSIQCFVVYYLLDIIMTALDSISILYGIESVPTTHRCTAVAMNAASSSFMTIILFHVLIEMNVTLFLYLLAGLSMVGCFIAWCFASDNLGEISSTYDEHNTKK